uniref:Uncharacterized protein n=1 Tax=Oryza brachyantha TaxID=4533 RepID=J3L509_ORYBR
MDCGERLAHPPLRLQIEQPLGAPRPLDRRHEPHHDDALRVVEGAQELCPPVHPHALLGEARRVLVERDAADIVEREALQHVLQVQRPAVALRPLEQRKQPVDDLEPDGAHYKVPQRPLAELVVGGPPLPQPLVAVGVEDAMAEEVLDDGHHVLPLGVVLEVGLDDVLDVGWVGSDGAGHEAEALEVEGHGVRGAARHDAGRPLDEAVLVLDEVRQRADDGVGLEAAGTNLLPGAMAAQAEEAEHRKQQEEEQGNR